MARQRADGAWVEDPNTVLAGPASGSDAGVAAFRALVAGDLPVGSVIKSGEHIQATASDTIVTGLSLVTAVVVTPRTRTVKQLNFNASPGDQAGTPAAGSILITSQKPTAVNDVTPIAATDFTDNIKVDWIAVGTA